MRFRHYKKMWGRKLYLKHINNTIKKERLRAYFEKIKITSTKKNIDLFAEVLGFIKGHDNCIIFISVDDFQYKAFMKLVHVVNNKTEVVKESQLKIGSVEYQLSLVIDNLLNIERRRNA